MIKCGFPQGFTPGFSPFYSYNGMCFENNLNSTICWWYYLERVPFASNRCFIWNYITNEKFQNDVDGAFCKYLIMVQNEPTCA